MDSTTAELLREIEEFLDESGMAATTLGQRALLNSKLVARLRRGGTVTLTTAATLRAFMREHRNRPRSRGNVPAAAA